MPKVHQTHRSELLVRCIPMLRSQVAALHEDRDTAHEALQEVILSILSAPSCPEDLPQFTAYARDVVQKVGARGGAKAEAPSSELPWDGELLMPLDAVDPEHAMDTREELSQAVDPLGDEAFELLVRRYVLGENANEIARSRAQTPAALRVRLMRLRSAARGRCPGHRPG